MITLNNIVICVGTGVIFISLIMAVSISRKDRSYMRWFFLCPLIAFLASINTIDGIFFSRFPNNMTFTRQNYLILVDLTFWFFFFIQILNNKRDRMQITILLVITLFISFYLLFISKAGIQNMHMPALGAICRTIFCIFFFYKLFKNMFYQNILKEPAFWIVSGLFLHSTLSFPFFGLNSYIRSQFSLSVSFSLSAISNMFIIIMHLFFLKAYLCTIRVYSQGT